MAKINSLVGDLTREIIDFIYSQTKKKNNKKKIKYIIDTLTKLLFHDIQPYLYTILAMLFIMFIINCFQFYYYIKLNINNKIPPNIGLILLLPNVPSPSNVP